MYRNRTKCQLFHLSPDGLALPLKGRELIEIFTERILATRTLFIRMDVASWRKFHTRVNIGFDN